MSSNMSNYIAAGFGGLMMIAAVGALIATPEHNSGTAGVTLTSAAPVDGISAGNMLQVERESRSRAEALARLDGIAAGERLQANRQTTIAHQNADPVWEFGGLTVPTTTQTWEFDGLTPPVTNQVWEFEGLTPPTTEQVWEFSGLGKSTIAQTGHHPATSPFTIIAGGGHHGYPTASIRRGGLLMTASGEALMAP